VVEVAIDSLRNTKSLTPAQGFFSSVTSAAMFSLIFSSFLVATVVNPHLNS